MKIDISCFIRERERKRERPLCEQNLFFLFLLEVPSSSIKGEGDKKERSRFP
jgi:hypothetical protein